jgi:hypothetical protein
MWDKIYLAVLAAALLVMSFFSFYSYSWLHSIGSPKDALAGYEYYAGLAGAFLWISTLVLLILANILFWKTRRAWALWTSFGYFAAFLLLRYFWLETASFNFQKENNLTDSSFSFSPVLGVILVIVAGVVVFFNQFLNLRLQQKMYPPRELPGEVEGERLSIDEKES